MSGYKTYIVAIVMGLLTVAKLMGWIDETAYQAALGFLGALGLGALRSGINTVNNSTPTTGE